MWQDDVVTDGGWPRTLDCGHRIGERDVTEVKDRDVAMVFQNYALYPHMTVAQNMGFALKVAKIGKAGNPQQVLATVKLLDLQSYLDRKPKDLRRPTAARVAMGRAIVRRPGIPDGRTAVNLDAKLRGQTRNRSPRLPKAATGYDHRARPGRGHDDG